MKSISQSCLLGYAVRYVGQVCRKCAVRFGPVCAKVRLFNTTAKRFRAGLAVGKLLICMDESGKNTLRDLPTLNQ